MNTSEVVDVAIVGGGVVGIAAALCLQDAGHSVVLIDEDTPGAGCSSGNAGVIANSFVLPLSSVGNILSAPKMLIDPLAPLALPIRHALNYAPWLWSFAVNALPSRRRHAIDCLIELNSASLPAWKRLLPENMYSRMFVERGMLDVVGLGGSLKSLEMSAKALAAEGVPIETLNSDEAAELEPLLKGRVAGATLHKGVAQVIDPASLSQAMMDRFTARGGTSARTHVVTVRSDQSGVEVVGNGCTLSARKAVICAGWWSAGLMGQFGLRAPLRAERGYHVMLPAVTEALSRPVSFHHEAFLATPMSGGLRLAGTVELAPPAAEPDWRRADNLLKLVGSYLPGLDTSAMSRWVGSRPSFADSLPAIGQVAAAPNVYYSFGHQHLGLTHAAISAEYIRDFIRGTMPQNAQAYSLARFGGAKSVHAA